MIQFNLLPDVKLEFVRAQRTKKTVISASIIAASSAFVIFLLLFLVVYVVQKNNLSNLNGDVKKYSTVLTNTPDLSKVLTIQSQLTSLPDLHANKVAALRNFSFIQQLTPTGITISDCSFDYTANTLTITGQADSLAKVNSYVDTVKFTKYDSGTVKSQPAFSSVVLSDFSKSGTATTYTMTANFDPLIFSNTSPVNLTIPTTVSTRSVVDQPTDLFKKAAPTNGSAQ